LWFLDEICGMVSHGALPLLPASPFQELSKANPSR